MSGQFSSGSSAGRISEDSTEPSGYDGDELAAASSPLREASRAGVGQQLQAGRLRGGMSVDDVARALKLSTRQVESIEGEDWAALPGKTMIRGFVRNYGRLVGLDGKALMSELEGLSMPKSPELRGAVGTPVSMPREGKSDRKDMLRVLAGMLALVLALLAYFFLPPDFWQSTVQAFRDASMSNQVVGDPDPELPTVSAASTAEASVPVEQSETVQPEPQVVPSEAPADPIQPVPVPEVQAQVANVLKFSFSQPSWVEVRDKNGQVIFSQKNAAGSEREVEGQPPFLVVIGNSKHVTLQYKGTSVDLSKRSKDDVARVTVE